MIIINGPTFTDNATLIRNSINVNTVVNATTGKKVGKTKKTLANGIDRIAIDSNVPVKVSACDTKKITAHIHGSAIMEDELEFSVTKRNKQLLISVDADDASALILDVQIPVKAFEEILVESTNSSINVDNSVYANNITAKSENGTIVISAIFRNLNIQSENGTVNVDSKAHCNVELEITSQNGIVDVALTNLGASNVYVGSQNGGTINQPNLNGVYTASGTITSKNGIVKFH